MKRTRKNQADWEGNGKGLDVCINYFEKNKKKYLQKILIVVIYMSTPKGRCELVL